MNHRVRSVPFRLARLTGFAGLLLGLACAGALPAAPGPGNRLAGLAASDPFRVDRSTPRLTTPMWFGEEGVEAAIILSIDDMRDESLERYRDFLAPILTKLQEVEGRSPLSIFTNRVDPSNPQLAKWIAQGVRFDVHTRTHPCPLLRGELPQVLAEVGDCTDNLSRIPGAPPAAFRMPCCDSINSASPRFFKEILPRRTAAGNFLRADSSVVVFLKDEDKAYAPFRNYAATADGYPYPYVIGNLIWEFPIIAPSDWQAQNRRGPFEARTMADLKANVDRVVAAQGVYTLCFHPHGWIRNDQVVEIIDHAVRAHGRKVRFLNFHEALERLETNLLDGAPLRAADGSDNGVRLLDLDRDGNMDAVIGNEDRREFRRWDPVSRKWASGAFPFRVVARGPDGRTSPTELQFGIISETGFASALARSGGEDGLATFTGKAWIPEPPAALEALAAAGRPIRTAEAGRDGGVRWRDVDGDGFSDLVVNNHLQNAVFRWQPATRRFQPTPYRLPGLAAIADAEGRDGGLRFADLNDDGFDDVLLSNDEEYYVYLYTGDRSGWARRVLHGPAGIPGALPKFVAKGEDQGAWIRDGVLYAASERTAGLPDLVETRRFDRMLANMSSEPLDPQAALRQFIVPDGFHVELVASEPLVQDPVAMDFSPDGKLYVVEMGRYPRGEGRDSGGRIKRLIDRDGDGRADESVLFADGLSFPAGVLVFRRGVLAACAPDILYLEDPDGDGRAEIRRPVFTGFGEGNQQHRVNGLHFGIDNWIYGANGDSGGSIRIAGRPDAAAVPIGGRDFRFSRDLLSFEAASGHTQFGLAMDDFGNRFGASNSRHLLHAVLPEEYLRRNPHYAAPDPVLDIPDHGAMARIYAASRELISLNDIHVPGHFSSACGLAIYRGENFPPVYQGSAFVCEPVANLVHRDILAPSGATFTARRGEEGLEFLTSTDCWFRPVYAANGPDGALYIVDMYRWIIEHPLYIPEELQQILDCTAGRDRGRIYRVVHGPGRGADRGPGLHPDVTRESTEALVGLLEHPGGWWRDTAQRLLVDRQDGAAAIPLRNLARNSLSPPARVHALRTLEGIGQLTEDSISRALADPYPAVQEHAAQLAEKFFAGSERLRLETIALAANGSFRVRLQAAFSLGNASGPEIAPALARIVRANPEDRWLRAAALSSSFHHAGGLLQELFSGSRALPPSSPGARDLLSGLALVIGRGAAPDELRSLLDAAAASPAVERWHLVLAGVLGDRLAGGQIALEPRALERIRKEARAIALDRSRTLEERLEAIRAAGEILASDESLSAGLLSPLEPIELQLAAVASLSNTLRRGSGDAERRLLAGWDAAGPQARGEILEAMLSGTPAMKTLLQAVSAGSLDVRSIDPERRRRLLECDDAEVRAQAGKLLRPVIDEPRGEVLSRYSGVLAGLQGSPADGKEVFRKICTPCHRLEGEGFEVGPDLSEARGKETSALLEAILNPGRMVAPRYTPYLVEKRNRQIATGILASETATAITLLRASGAGETILRADIRRLQASGGSLMPAEIEKEIPPQAMADLLQFLRETPRRLDALAPDEIARNRQQALAEGHNGLARILRSAGQERQASWIGALTLYYARQTDGKQEVAWQTDPAPASPDASGRVVFRFPAALGYIRQPAGSFTLYLDQRKLLEFNVSLESREWQGPDGQARLRFKARACNDEDATGLMTLELPASYLEPGKPATLRVVGSQAASRRWFGLLPLR